MATTFGWRGEMLLLGLAACGLLAGGGSLRAQPKPPETREAVLVGEKDDGKTIELPAKQHLLVTLEFRAGTGYHWEVKDTPKELRFVHHYLIKPFSAQPIGGNRVAGFDFGATEPGTCDLEFELHAPGGKLDKTVKYTVKVGESK
jgi:hypothetical protein